MKFKDWDNFFGIDGTYWTFFKCSKDFEIEKVEVSVDSPFSMKRDICLLFEVKESEIVKDEKYDLKNDHMYFRFETKENIYIVALSGDVDIVYEDMNSRLF